MKSEMNWTAVGALATIASAFIAFLTLSAPVNVTGSPATPQTNTVALSSLRDPCQIPTAYMISAFNVSQGYQTAADESTEQCKWTSFNPSYAGFSLTYFAYAANRPVGSVPVSIPGVPNATAGREVGRCVIQWNTSFGSIMVGAGASSSPVAADPCVGALQWANALLAELPN